MQTAPQAEAALAVGMATVQAAIQQTLGSSPDQLAILVGSPDTAYAGVRQGYNGVRVLRSTDGGRTWTKVWNQQGSVDDYAANRAGPLVVDPLSGQLWIGTSFGLYRDQTAVDQPPAARDITALATDPVDPHRLWVGSDATTLTYAGKTSGIGLFRRRDEAGTVAWEDMTAGLTRTVVAIGFDSARLGQVYLRLRGGDDVVSAAVPERIAPELVGWTPVAAAPRPPRAPTESATEALRVRTSYPTDLLIDHTIDAHGSLGGYPLALGGLVYARSYWWHGGMYGHGLSSSRDGGVSWHGVGGYSNFGHLWGAREVFIWDNRERVVFADNGLPGIAGQSMGPWTAHPLDANTVYQCQVGRGHLYRSYDLSQWEELTAGLDPMLEPRAVVVDSLSRVYLVTSHGTFMHQDLVRPYRIASLTVTPDTLRLSEDTPAVLVVKVETTDPASPEPQVTVASWAGEQTVPQQADGRYALPLPSIDGLEPGFYGITVTAAPPGMPLARASAMQAVMVAPGHELPIFAEGTDPAWQSELRTGTMDLASTHAHAGPTALEVNGEVVFRHTGEKPIHPFGYRLEFYATAPDSYLVQGLQVNGLGLQALGARRRPAGDPGTWYRIDLPAERILVAPRFDPAKQRYSPAFLDEVVITATAAPGKALYLDDIRLVPVGREDAASPTAVLSNLGAEPRTFRLSPTFPNPFNASTVIPFELARDGQVRLGVYNLLGQQVRHLLSAWLAAGTHALSWDGRTDSGQPLATGVYLVRLESGPEARMAKVMLLR